MCIKVGGTKSVVSPSQAALNSSSLAYSPHRWMENPGLLCSGPNVGNNCMEVVMFAETSTWS